MKQLNSISDNTPLAKSKTMNLEQIAHHEAGHAAIALMFNVDFDYVTIVPNEKNAGHLEFGNSSELKGFWKFKACIEIMLAGGCAEALFLNAPNLSSVSNSMACDIPMIEDVINKNSKYLSRKEVKPFLQWLEVRTMVHLGERWTYVKKIAAALLKKKKLTCQECKEIIGLDKVAALAS